jgi:hypothetical protein
MKPRPWTPSNQPSPKIQEIVPHSVSAEQGILSSMMQPHGGKEAIAEAIVKVDAQHFYVPAHRTIFIEIRDLYEGNKAIDLITFTQHLRDRNLLDSVGGAGFVSGLFTFVPTAANISYYIEIVRDKYLLRETVAACNEAVRRAHEEQSEPSAVLDAIESKAASLRSLHGRNGAFTMRSPNEILALPRDQSANFLGDRVLAKGQSLLMAGIGDLGKSRLNLQQIAALTIERPWCGLETHAKGIKAVIFQAENINHRLQDDLEALKRSAGKDWKLIDQNIRIHTLETDEDFIVALSDPAKAREMERIVRYEKPGIVSFDAVYNFGIGDLNTDQDMLATCRAMTKVARAGNPDCALIMLHHALTGREGMKKAYGFERSGFARNSKVIFQSARAQINIVPGSEDYSVLLLFCAKNNNGKRFEDIAIRLNPETLIYEPEPDFDFEGWKEQITAKKAVTRQKFTADMVRQTNLRFTECEIKPLAQLISDKIGCGRTRAYELVAECTTAKLFRHNKITDTYVKT